MSTEEKSRERCYPGQCLGLASEKIAGYGTYERSGRIYASLFGYIEERKRGEEIIVDVKTGKEQNVVPSVGSIVTAKVTSINRRFCKCNIICIESTVLKEPFRGMIRKEDVREKEKDKVEIYKSFRPGDIILARVISIGDVHSYILSTAENELGVAIAYSETGNSMVPISWTEMMCEETLNKEYRKVAKVVPPNFVSKKN